MGRWEPDAKGRLAQAAVDLYVERGFEQTTVADFTERAGDTERTFFRHFSDKRDVFFEGRDGFREMFITAVEGAPADATPMQIVELALNVAAADFEPRVVGRAHSSAGFKSRASGARAHQGGAPQDRDW